MTAAQLALDCDPTWHDPEPDDDEDDTGPWCTFPLDLGGQGIGPHRLATMTTIQLTGGYL